ncbi:DUF4041 domain-containing protein [Psychromonas sp. SR45-3]|uniref:DUF4041 domain-containing protein n=1 Tax=Psychromonas sp. SR45-3 TaxID=2760930 RepID=UPI0015F8E634|nr:DUF4041 domain-containing protein [Psychromonas sp. SR45-3]MBB1271233.1 DUF4041 domain-containing protein [Psychromonas sp. SR45-3]
MTQIQIIASLSAVFLLLVIAVYFFIKGKYDKQSGEFKTLQSGIEQSKKELGTRATLKDELDSKIAEKNAILSTVTEELAEVIALKGKEKELLGAIKSQETEIEVATKKVYELNINAENLDNEVQGLMSYLDLYSQIDEFTSVGHYEEPEYLFETSLRFAEQIKDIRQQQKDMIKDKIAITFPEDTVISSDKAFNKKILNGQVKLMLTSFNIETDLLIANLKPSNFARTIERIEKLANNLEKNSATFECGFNTDYVGLKFEECKLQYQYTLKKQEEITEQKLIREQIKEEQRAIKEYEKAIADAEKEEKLYRSLLEKARQELLELNDEERMVAENRIEALELQLAEAEAKEERAKSMAQQTRKGHVYVISNIGSFGENVYKIGLTRRLEPLDRVKELGDASVPFIFDVHAMIYVEDAPALESALHREFNKQRVNAVNFRKEFFNIDLDSIKDAVERIAGVEAEFKMTALAEDYYESKRLRGDEVII